MVGRLGSNTRGRVRPYMVLNLAQHSALTLRSRSTAVVPVLQLGRSKEVSGYPGTGSIEIVEFLQITVDLNHKAEYSPE